MNHDELLRWIDEHAGLARLCERGGWPDGATLRMENCSKTDREWVVDICFEEVLQEMSECDSTRTERCGKFAIQFDTNGIPEAIRLLHPM
ncbi:MAG: hypothetical protein Q9M29_03970 [Mariprofundaceae bacterium]|nr:hypothetical protein [Mariprofundaceae bacterium]